MKVVSVVSAKGGVGKTTIAANLASVLAAQGRHVVAIDLDPQNSLRLYFGVPLDSVDGLSRAALAGALWQSAIVDGSDGVTVLAFGALVEAEQHLFERRLDQDPTWLARGIGELHLGEDDIVIIDTPPGSSAYTRAALSAAHFAVNVVLADAASYAAIPQMQRMIDAYAAPRPEFVGEGYVVNQIDQSRQLNKDVLRVLREMLGSHMFPGVIHDDDGVSESLACNTTIVNYDPLSQVSADLRACAAWLLDALEARRPAARGSAA
ncbi:cellulose synthase operon protein YhjQ [Burkholderia glumae]|uniref:cellulose biosynthesis protein BcsQ n=1 Tax=Burkholderia glumae TaxID=337 RepID=UPI0003A4B966|nr:cellulose biosynthesis protein BcsQ [Burkholderia glumae]MCM2494734.1 cellulose biosynthesis protein BcsQ [Burkholderia glumae]MCM2545604.1 cellulose biosynthesis protein BcsQ [Burkholderia glumae]MCQ0033189.1 cellulose biosynthesis protein BcsQ [Burkholderia glumae]MCQ0040380.1 cellulose biosynthesis protein BcsQ [Burkholderia glumae]MCR1769289.1 cellulose synthase operon protein YhjQ [Burkholderia glumae]